MDRHVGDVTKVEAVFHGTLRRNVESIVKGGFIIQGSLDIDGERVSVRCGSTWGNGM